MILVTSVEVERRPLGFSTFARCVAEQDRDSMLTVRSIDDGIVLARYARDDWRVATVADDRGVVVDSLTSRIPHHPTGALFETAVLLAKVHGGTNV